ncbi:hypothetical protein SLEP1_g12744 [Rubroshorea leprosula]|uniref:Uncharacterized protein n=1 Tax=Rubroshorea leprosula TaxID=152421 RepID=A0AAV5IJ91_9ROSI|nr:hypothetical protein SLEP1_g12744 [Rubroshorea leprosula]
MMHFINMGTFSRTPKEVNNGADIVWLAVISTHWTFRNNKLFKDIEFDENGMFDII